MGNAKTRFYVHKTEQPDGVFCLENSDLNAISIPEIHSKHDYAVGLISDKELIAYSFDMEKGLSQEELEDAVEIRMFQDAGLNHMIDYRIAFGSSHSLVDVKNISVNAFAAARTLFSAAFETFKKRANYIDTILPLSTLPFCLYEAEVLEKKSDLFLNIREKESTIAFFHNGDYVYAKTLTTGFKQLHEQFVRNNNEGVSYDAFVNAVTTKGVDSQRYSDTPDNDIHHVDILPLFEKLLTESMTVIGYVRRITGIEGFERFFFGSEKGTIPGIGSYIKASTGIQGADLEFYTPFYAKGDPYIDQNVVLAMIEAGNANTGRRTNPYNLTIYPRPPRFIHRQSGRFVSVIAASVVAALLYPAYLFVDTRWQSYAYDTTLQKLQLSQGEFSEQKAKEDLLKNERTRYEALLTEEKEKLRKSVELLQTIATKKQSSRSLSERLAILFNQLNTKKVQICTLDLRGGDISLDLQAKEDKDLTAFVRAISRKQDFLVDMGGFTFDESTSVYLATVVLKGAS